MLANGITLGQKASAETSGYTNLPGLKTVPDMGVTPEKVENTGLSDTVKQYELGIGDAGDLDYVFKYSTANWTTLAALAGAKKYYEHKLPDGTTFEFAATGSVKVSGGGVNGVLEITLSLALQSNISVTPASTNSTPAVESDPE